MPDLTDKLHTLDIQPGECAHVWVISSAICSACNAKPCCFICPSNVFYSNPAGQVAAKYTMCIECGACKLACPKDNIALDYPRGGVWSFFP